jgi:uncharacterized membrane protein
MKKLSIKQISFISMFTALVFLATLIQIRMPYGGNINLGDAMIMLCATLMGPIPAMIAGGIGACVCDVALGYGMYAPFTFFIKALEGLVCGILMKDLTKKEDTNKNLKFIYYILIYVLSILVMVFGYLIANGILLGWTTAIVVIPFDLIQASASVLIVMLLIFVAKIDKIFDKVYNKNDKI